MYCIRDQWAAKGEKRDEERYGQFSDLSGQGELCCFCFELFVVCLRDTEDSQTGENCNSQGAKEQSQRPEYLWHLRTEDDGWN